MSIVRPLPRYVLPIAVRLARVVCPLELRTGRRTGSLLRELGLYLAALPPHLRFGFFAALVALDQGARFYPPARGRRFARLDPNRADAYFRHLLTGSGPRVRDLARLLKGIITLCYYELPASQADINYDPIPYVQAVARRRLESYGEEIRRGEEAVFADEGRLTTDEGRKTKGEGGRTKDDRALTTVDRPWPIVHRPSSVNYQPATINPQLSTIHPSSDLTLSCDVVIVGSGAGGAVMAAELADAGVDVVVVEEGGYYPTESLTPSMGRALRELYRDGGSEAALGSPPILISQGRCVGGSTVINGGMCWRTPDAVLERWASREAVADIVPSRMAPYFAKVERRINVAHQDPESIGHDQTLLKLGADRLGWHIIPNLRNQLHCGGCNVCTSGCPTGAKRSMLVTYLPRALSRGARLYSNCRVERITRRGKRATGVTGRFTSPDGRPGARLTVRAGVVVAACGAMQTPALLWRSGFRSPSGQLGRNLALHPNAKVVALFDEDVHGWQGVHQAYQVREFMDDGILITAINLQPSLLSLGLPHHGRELGDLLKEYNRMVVGGCLIEDSTSGRVQVRPGIGPVASYQVTPRDVERIVRGISLTAELMFAAGARRVILPFAGAPDLFGPEDMQEVRTRPIPRDSIELLTVHVMGTARMSEDRSRGVVSSFGEFHDAAGLFVADASLFPGPVGVNPMETILALVTRNAEWLVANRSHYGI